MGGTWLLVIFVTALTAAQECCPHDPNKCEDSKMKDLKVPEGFCVSIYTKTSGSRALHVEDHDTLGTVVFVTSKSNSAIQVLIDSDQDGIVDRTTSFSSTAKNAGITLDPNSGALWVAERTTLRKYDDIMDSIINDSEPVGQVMFDQLSKAGHHGKRCARFSPDGRLYVSIGSPCNVCRPETQSCSTDSGECFYGSILRMNITEKEKLEEQDIEVYAKGIRNSVGFDWNPSDHTMWFTDNGRDNWGNDRPPCELNHAPEPGLHFGFPYCHGYNEPDEGFNDNMDCSEYRQNALGLGAHVAPLGMTFYTGSQFPPPYDEGIFLAEHGSWNRLPFVGFRVIHARLGEKQENTAIQTNTPILEGFMTDKCEGSRWGRPADVKQLPDGSLIISDSESAIYRITYDSSITPSDSLGDALSIDASGRQTCANDDIEKNPNTSKVLGLAIGIPVLVIFCFAICGLYLVRGKKSERPAQSIFSVNYERQEDIEREQGQEMPFVAGGKDESLDVQQL